MIPTTDLATTLLRVLDTLAGCDADDLAAMDLDAALPLVNSQVQSFEQAGILTRDAGLVLTLADGSEYQVTVIRSKGADR